MKKSTRNVLIAMIILLLILVAVIVYLALTDNRVVPEQELGDTIIAENARAEAGDETQPVDQLNPTEAAEEPVQEAETEPAAVDLPNEKEVQLYVSAGNNTMDVVASSYDSTWTVEADIATFETINSDEDSIQYDDYYMLHENYWNAVETDTEYKIGYELSFDVNGEHKVVTILEPSDITGSADLYMGDYSYDENGALITDGITGYLGVWVYHDIGQEGIYVHLTQEDMTDDVLLTSIKLRPTPQSDQISNLKLKAFSYSSDTEFNSAGQYIGTHGYEIAVNNS